MAWDQVCSDGLSAIEASTTRLKSLSTACHKKTVLARGGILTEGQVQPQYNASLRVSENLPYKAQRHTTLNTSSWPEKEEAQTVSLQSHFLFPRLRQQSPSPVYNPCQESRLADILLTSPSKNGVLPIAEDWSLSLQGSCFTRVVQSNTRLLRRMG